MSRRPLRVGLLWHSANSGNLGLGALTIADMALIERAAQRVERSVSFVVLSFREDGPAYPQLADVPRIELTNRDLLNPRVFARAVRSCDVVIDIGGGDSFTDIYGLRRLGYMTYSKLMVASLGTPLVLAPQTIGPFGSVLTRSVADHLIRLSAATFARDDISVERVRDARARDRITVTTDVAFALPYERAERTEGTVRVGLSVSQLLFRSASDSGDRFGLAMDYPRFVRGLIASLRSRPEAEVVLIPHVASPGGQEDDFELSGKLASEYGLASPDWLADPVQAKSTVARCDFFVGSRMHSCIAAVSSGVATVPVAYSRKFSGLFESLGYHRTVDARTHSTEEALAAVLAHYDGRDAIAREASAAAAVASDRLERYVEGLTTILRDL